MTQTRALIVATGDQLSLALSSLQAADKTRDRVLMAEGLGRGDLCAPPQEEDRLPVQRDAPLRRGTARGRMDGRSWDARMRPAIPAVSLARLRSAVAAHRPERIVVTEAGEWRVAQMLGGWEAAFGIPVDVLPDTRFLCPLPVFCEWAAGRKQLRMEYFYRDMRRRTGLLMDGDQPTGGQWNFDAENRKSAALDLFMPRPPVVCA